MPLLTVLAVACAAQEEGEPSDGGNDAGTSSGARAGGGAGGASGAPTAGSAAGGTAAGGGSTNGGNAGTTNGGRGGGAGASNGGEGATTSGGNAGTTSGGNGGRGGAGGAAGAGGASSGGAGGTAGTSASAGAAGTGGGGSGGTGPVNPCDNDQKDGSETDVDCGGSVCAARCSTNQGCSLVTDCQSDGTVHHVCDGAKCRLRGCTATNCAYELTRFIIGTATAASARGQVFVTWSATALLLDFQIHDTTPKNDSAENWQDDSVEIYLDLNHAKSATFDADDFQINVPRVGTPQAIGAVNTGAIAVTGSDDNQDYRLQVTVPWSALNNAGSQVGKTIGFSIGLNDDANAAPERDTQVMLYGTADNYMNASQFGDLQLD